MSALGGVSAWWVSALGGGVCLLLGGVCSGGRGVSAPGGCLLPGGGVCSQGCLLRGGVCSGGGGCIPPCTEADTSYPVDRQTPVKT